MLGILIRLAICCWIFLVDTGLASGSLAALPRVRNVHSEMTLFDDHLGDVGGVFNIIEFIDQNQGSSRIDISDESKDRLSFFRLMQVDRGINSELVRFEHKLARCSEDNTNDWPLKDFTQMLEKLYATNEKDLETKKTKSDPLMIGPNALLQIVHDNVGKFIYDGYGFDDINLANTYYFSTQPFRFGLEDEAKLIVMAQKNHINFDAHNDADNMQAINSKLKIGSTKLSEVHMLGHIAGVVLVTDTERLVAKYLSKPSAQLVDFAQLRPSRFAMSLTFSLIEQRSHARHLGVSEPSPLLLPAGVGCGQPASRHQPLFVLARQFSGHFSAMDHPNELFVAYDEASNHMRYDSLGRHKMIFALSDHLASLIQLDRGDGGGEEPQLSLKRVDDDDNNNNNNNPNRVHENSYHCARMDLVEEESPQNQLVNVMSLGDVLGLGGSDLGLMYLGYDHLLNCHLYEREISYTQIPLLVRLNLRLKPSPLAKFTLVFHFVNELDSLTGNSPFQRQVHAYESMWLKRLDLISLLSVSKHTLRISQLDFSRSGWSLAVASEASHEQEVLHPSRMFDMLECWPAEGQTQLDFVLKRMKSIGKGGSGGDGGGDDDGRAPQTDRVAFTETLEESLMQFLTQQIGFPRSEVCALELLLPDEDLIDCSQDLATQAATSQSNDTDSRQLPETMLVRSKLIRPLEFTFQKSLVGWLKTIVRALKLRRHAEVFDHRYMMNIQECVLSLAAKLSNPNQFHMLYCPRVGCGHLLDAKVLRIETTSDDGLDASDELSLDNKLEYTPLYLNNNNNNNNNSAQQRQQAPSLDSYPEMCEIHLVTRHISTQGLITERFRPEVVHEKLHQSKMILEVYEVTANDAISTRLHQAIVSEVTLRAGLEGGSRDDQLHNGLCFSLRASFELANSTLAIKMAELNFDQHHSRVHCHKACLAQDFCQSYSYSRARRICHLSSASRRLLEDPELRISSSGPSDCTIHSLNHLSLYKRMPFVIYETLAGLLKEKSDWRQPIECSLDECAHLCRLNELGQSGACQRFSYIRMRSLCIVEGNVRVPEELAGRLLNGSKPAELEGLDDRLEPGERYQRNFLQDYAVKYNAEISLDQPEAAAREINEKVGPERAVKTMMDLREFECSRECSILDPECVAFDWCPSTKLTSYKLVCRLYRVRSPLTVPRLTPVSSNDSSLRLPESSPFEAQLTKLEVEFYSAAAAAAAARSSEHKIRLEPKQTCKHFYLEGDNLYLKRVLSVAMRNYQHEQTSATATSIDVGAENNYSPGQTQTHLGRTSPSSSPADNKRVLSKALVGFLLGLALFLLQPKLAGLILGGKRLEWFQANPVRERSMSQVEITEMIDLDEDEDEQDSRSRR